MVDEKTKRCEYGPLERVRDNYPMYLLTGNDPANAATASFA